jgi:uncharacterized protein (TIGR02186 family)
MSLSKHVLLGIAAAAFVLLNPVDAQADTLTTLLSTNRVEIHSTYSGAEIVIFGAMDFEGAAPPAGGVQIAVTVTGPRNTIIVQKKERVGPIWINRVRVRYDKAPGYHAVMSSEPLSAITDAATIKDMTFDPADDVPSSGAPDPQRMAYLPELVRLRKADGLFRKDEAGIGFVGNRLFQTRITLPANAPLGRYFVSTHAFSGGKSIASSSNEFFLTKTGFEALVASEARNRPWLYGLTAMLSALGLGWLASVAFRRD